MAKTADLELLHSPKLISRKIWVAEKSWNFHTVYSDVEKSTWKEENFFSNSFWSWSTSFVKWVLQFSTFKGLMTVNEVFQFTKVKFKLRPTFLQSENVCHPSLKFSNQKSWKVPDSQAQIAIWQKFELFFYYPSWRTSYQTVSPLL